MKEKIVTYEVWLQLAHRAIDARGIGKSVEPPAAMDVELRQVRLRRLQLVGQNGKAEQRSLLQLTCDMKPVFIESPPARRERTHQTNFHGPLLASKRASNAPPDEVWFDRGQQN